MQALRVNPICRTRHYQFYFNVSRTTAWRMQRDDKVILQKRMVTFQDFYVMYGGFPDSKFHPVWVKQNVSF